MRAPLVPLASGRRLCRSVAQAILPVPTNQRSTIVLDKHLSPHRSFRTQGQTNAAIAFSHLQSTAPANLRHRQDCLCYQNRGPMYYNSGT
jgi:hypothetical protein